MKLTKILNWSVIITSLLLLLFWGSFFIEHIFEWYIRTEAKPPAFVSISMLAHALLLTGYIIIFWQQKIGSLLILLMAPSYFLPILGLNGILFMLISIIPSALYLLKVLFEKYRVDSTE